MNCANSRPDGDAQASSKRQDGDGITRSNKALTQCFTQVANDRKSTELGLGHRTSGAWNG